MTNQNPEEFLKQLRAEEAQQVQMPLPEAEEKSGGIFGKLFGSRKSNPNRAFSSANRKGLGKTGPIILVGVLLTTILVVAFLKFGPVISFPVPSPASTEEIPPEPIKPQVVTPGTAIEPQGIGLADVPKISFLQFLIMALAVLFGVTLYMQARDRENFEDFWGTITSISITNMPIVSGFIKKIHDTGGIASILDARFAIGLVIGLSVSGGMSLFPIGCLVALMGLFLFLTGNAGAMSNIIGISSGKVYQITTLWKLIENKNMEAASFSIWLYILLLAGLTCLIVEEIRSRQAQGALLISLTTVGFYELLDKGLNRPEFALILTNMPIFKFVPLMAAAGLLVILSMFLRRYGKGIFSIGGNTAQQGMGLRTIGSPWTAVGFAILIGAILLIAFG